MSEKVTTREAIASKKSKIANKGPKSLNNIV